MNIFPFNLTKILYKFERKRKSIWAPKQAILTHLLLNFLKVDALEFKQFPERKLKHEYTHYTVNLHVFQRFTIPGY